MTGFFPLRLTPIVISAKAEIQGLNPCETFEYLFFADMTSLFLIIEESTLETDNNQRKPEGQNS